MLNLTPLRFAATQQAFSGKPNPTTVPFAANEDSVQFSGKWKNNPTTGGGKGNTPTHPGGKQAPKFQPPPPKKVVLPPNTPKPKGSKP